MTSEKVKSNITSEESLLGNKAFNVFNNYILSEVANENKSLEKENVLLQPHLNRLNSIEIRSNDGQDILYSFPGLDNAIMKREPEGSIGVVITECDGTSIPLATLRRVGSVDQRINTVYLSNQLFGEMVGARLHVEDGCIKLQLSSSNCQLIGKIGGLSIEDIRQLQSNEISDQQIRRYLLGEDNILSSSPNATFTPVGWWTMCENKNHGVIKSACLLQMSTINPMEDSIRNKEEVISSMKDQLKKMQRNEAKILAMQEQSQVMLVLATGEKRKKVKQTIDELEESLTSVISMRKRHEKTLRKLVAQNKIDCEQYIRPSQYVQYNDIPSQADTLRDLCFSVLNRSSDLEILRNNRKIKRENMNMKDIHIHSTTVQIYHEGGTFNMSPNTGHRSDEVNGIEMWRLPVHNRSIDANEVHTLKVSLAGITCEKNRGRVFLNPNEPCAVQLEIKFNFGGRLQG